MVQILRAGGAVLAHSAGAAVPKQQSRSTVFKGMQNAPLHDLTALAEVTYLHKCICLRLPRLRKSLISDSLSRSQWCPSSGCCTHCHGNIPLKELGYLKHK